MAGNTSPKRITLPKDWPEFVKSAIIHVISLAGVVISNARGFVANGTHGSAQYKIRNEALENEIGLLKEELRIKDARTSMIDALKRPHYRPQDRLAILELKAMRGWTAAETARKFLLRPRTISSWLKRIDEKGIVPRYGSVGEIGSIAILERFFKSAKGEWLRRTWIPYRRKVMHRKMKFYIDWYNEHRPHESLQGCTPKEIYENIEPAHERNRFEPRESSPAKHRKRRLCLQVKFYGRSRCLPVVEIKQAA